MNVEVWTTPSCYVGYNPVGHILAWVKHRDSEILAESNYDYVSRELLKVAMLDPWWIDDGNGIPRLEDIAHDGPFSHFDPTQAPILYTWRAWSSLVGWIEYLMIRPCAESRPIIERLREIKRDYDAYLILDDNDYSERQDDAIYADWKSDSLKYRIQRCREAGDSIFAARNTERVPEKVYDLAREVFV